MIKLSFHGAAGTVTGSKYHLQVDGSSILIDCGMFQGASSLRQLNWEKPAFDFEALNAVVLTHAHIDHIGYLPRLIKCGFSNPVYTTPPTADLAAMSLLDSAHIQEEDAEYRNRKKLTRHKEALPLFNTEDAKTANKLMTPVSFGKWVRLSNNIRFRLHVVGHVLGAAGVEVEATDGDRRCTVFFSGDVGRYGNPLTANPAPPPETDYLVCESTYGGRMHEPEDPRAVFIDLINRVHRNKSILLIPAFAVSRTQQVTYLINELIRHGLIPPTEINIDSPMAISATDIYRKYPGYHSVDIKKIGGKDSLLNGRNVHLHRKRKSSKVLNKLKGPAVIISSSGMLTGGRIMHHLITRLPQANTVIALAGFMAEGTLGRRLADGDKEVRIHKQPIEVRAEVIHMHGLSGHADFYEMMHWLEPIKKKPKRVFVTHGELSQTEAMAARLSKERGWQCHIPTLGESVEL